MSVDDLPTTRQHENPKTAQFTIWNVSFELNLNFIGSGGSEFNFDMFWHFHVTPSHLSLENGLSVLL